MAARWSLSPSSQSRQLWEVKEHPPDPGKYRKIGRISTYLPGLSDLRCDSEEEPPDLPRPPVHLATDATPESAAERAYLAMLAFTLARQVLACKEYREADLRCDSAEAGSLPSAEDQKLNFVTRIN